MGLVKLRGRNEARRWYWVPEGEVVEDHEVYVSKAAALAVPVSPDA